MNLDLYSLYSDDDLRKTLYYKSNGNGTYAFKGTYDGALSLFGGVATDEVYLTRAEGYAHENKITEAIADINTLLNYRYKKGKYIAIASNITKEDLLSKILKERRLELYMRGVRWMDIKRLNKEGANISLTRTVNGKTYTLPANSLRFAIPLPEEVVASSDLIQNLY